jgi:Ca2+-binding RTX toxin-like protein
LLGEAGDDLLAGEGGLDLVRGGEGDDTISGGNGHDVLFGDEGADWLQGDGGNDALRGGDGDDRLKGGAGRDELNGDAGQNLLDGDAGRNTLTNGEAFDFDAPPPPTEFLPLFAGLDGGLTGGAGQAVYERQSSPGGLETFLHITVMGVPANAAIDIAINGIVIGQIHSDGDGFAEFKFSSIVDEPGEVAFPANFNLAADDTITIGPELSGVFTLA